MREGIEWTHIDYFNNAVICELIEAKNGLLATMDDACLRPGQVCPLLLVAPDFFYIEKLIIYLLYLFGSLS